MNIQDFIAANKDRFIEEWKELLRFPSISANPDYKEEMVKTTKFIINQMNQIGLDNCEVMPTKGHPVVYGEKIIGTDLPTVLVYGHYDVQPADPLELWDSEPFDPVIKKTELHPEGAMFARGACDDKGQFFMHFKALEYLLATDQLSCNVKVIVEGEEEVGSPNLGPFIQENKEKLACDVILISDTGIIANDTPSITTGLRGLSYIQMKVTGPNRDLHSGLYGGAVANPINILCDIINSLMDENRHIVIPGFYDDVEIVSEDERAQMAKAPFDLDDYKAALEINEVLGESGFSTLERTTIRPTLDLNGIWGGYTGEGAKTVLPSEAYAKISMRLVPDCCLNG